MKEKKMPHHWHKSKMKYKNRRQDNGNIDTQIIHIHDLAPS